VQVLQITYSSRRWPGVQEAFPPDRIRTLTQSPNHDGKTQTTAYTRFWLNTKRDARVLPHQLLRLTCLPQVSFFDGVLLSLISLFDRLSTTSPLTKPAITLAALARGTWYFCFVRAQVPHDDSAAGARLTANVKYMCIISSDPVSL
jgi:hypothetical protein